MALQQRSQNGHYSMLVLCPHLSPPGACCSTDDPVSLLSYVLVPERTVYGH